MSTRMDVTVRTHGTGSGTRHGSTASSAAVADCIPTDELVAFKHTEVMDGFEGQGVGSTLVGQALDGPAITPPGRCTSA